MLNIFKSKKEFNQDFDLDMNNIPNHIAIIMDGNGRWAKNRIYLEVWDIKQE